MLSLHQLSKSFGPVAALIDVSLSAAPGTIHGVLGENGAGKSTLMKILFGLVKPDRGSITLDGRDLRLGSPRDAMAAGFGMVHQHFTLVPTLTVGDSCILGAGGSLGRIDHRGWRERIDAIAKRLRWELPQDALIRDLAVGQQQRVEIVKALLAAGADAADGSARVLILDEPTAVLTPQEVDELLPALRRLADSGTTVLFISHKLHEVERLCDDVTVLRRGALVHTGRAAGVTRDQLAELLVGSPWPGRGSPRRASTILADAAIRLRIDRLTVPGPGRKPALAAINASVLSGEIVGIAGVDGNGQQPLVRAILGLEPRATGTIDTPGIPADARRCGPQRLGLIPDDRQHEALILALPVADNLALKDRRRPPFTRWPWLPTGGWLDRRAWHRHAIELIGRFAIRCGGSDVPVASLSGGNQQKVVVARELHQDPGLVIAVNPTRGLDLAAARDVLDRLVAARDRGAGVLLIHHDLDELLEVADRVLVLFDGRLTDAGWPGCDRERIGRLMLGAG